MLQTHHFVLGDYQTNCFAIRHHENTQSCCLIDPGYRPDLLLRYLKQENLTLEAILLTHGHFDHVGAVRELAAETDCKVYIHAAEAAMPPMLTGGKLYYTDTYDEGDTLHLSGLDISVIHTPGHTPGSVCLMVGSSMFSGDTLFAGSCGRTDLPGGDWKTIRESLGRLASLEGDFTVFPGHGESTTLALEKQYNPYLR